MTYTPRLVTEPELRNAFTPAITTEELSPSGAISIIQMTEHYIQYGFFNGVMPSADDAKAPALALTMDRLLTFNPNITKTHKPIDNFSIGDYKVSYSDTNSFKEYADMAKITLRQLDMKNRHKYIIKSND